MSTNNIKFSFMPQTSQRFELNQYRNQKLGQLSPDTQDYFNFAIQAIGRVLTYDGLINGTALAVSKSIIITPKHCFPDNEGTIVFPNIGRVKAQTLIDGELDPPIGFKADYKVLEVVSAVLTPARLSVSAPTGESLQIGYQLDGRLCVVPYTEDSFGNFASRSSQASVVTINGDSGSARFSLALGAVHGIHQGESEALKINDIYHSLETIQTHEAKRILEEIKPNIIDPQALGTDFSTVHLQMGQVIPERHGTLQSIILPRRDNLKKINHGVWNDIIEFLRSFNSLDQKKDFYSRIWGSTDTQYKLSTYKQHGTRLDTQPPVKDKANLQIQVGDQTVATVLVSYQLARRSFDPKIAEVVNYVLRKFEEAIYHARSNQQAVMFEINPL